MGENLGKKPWVMGDRNNMRTKSVIVAMLGVLIGSLPGFAARPTTQEAIEMMNRMEQASIVDFKLKGVVVDEEGKPIPQVTMLVVQSTPKDFGFNSKVSERSLKVDGPFSIEVSHASSVQLVVACEGYFEQRLQYSSSDGLPKDWRERIMAGEVLAQGNVKLENIKVVLEKHGPLVPLEDGGGVLKLNANGKAKAWSWEKNYPGWRVDVEDWRDEAKLPKVGIYFLVDTDDKGNLLMLKNKFKASYPQKIRIIMKDEGGFVLVPSVGNSVKQYRSMKEAPEKGYEKEIVLEGEALQKHIEAVADDARDGYFYFKTSKGYGKGSFRVHAGFQPSEAEITLLLRFQKDGSRLMATED